MLNIARLIVVIMAAVLLLTACKSPGPVELDYTRKLAPGEKPLVRLHPDDWPNIELAIINRVNAVSSIEKSLSWFDKPSTKQFYPKEAISHTHARLSVKAFKHIMETSQSPAEDIRSQFDCYTSVGFDREGSVLFTGYYSPIFDASKTKTKLYKYPLYKRPGDLLSDPVTGQILGKKSADKTIAYPTRSQIEKEQLLKGKEIAWLRDPFDVYIIHIQGSARLDLTDGSTLYLGYAGHNGHSYTSVAKLMVEEGVIEPAEVSLQTLRQYFHDFPDTFNYYQHQNDRFVFFQKYPKDTWPSGSLGLQVTALRTLATDKTVFPRGGVVLVKTRIPTHDGSTRSFVQFMLDQDTGGAIKAPGRADIYMGSGKRAETIAGKQFATGNLYYFFLKFDRIRDWQIKR